MKAMLFAAGLGTRLKPFTDNHPKALAPVNGKTLLEHSLRYLQRFGIWEVIVNVHHFAEQIEDCLTENNGFGSNVTVSDERGQVLETGGGLLKAAPFFTNEDFVVMNVDILTDLDLNRMVQRHHQTDAMATLAVMNRQSSRQLLFDQRGQLCGWRNKVSGEEKLARKTEPLQELAFSGIQVIHTDFFTHITQKGKFSIIDSYLQLAREQTIMGFDHSGDLLLDVGKPESLDKAATMFA